MAGIGSGLDMRKENSAASTRRNQTKIAPTPLESGSTAHGVRSAVNPMRATAIMKVQPPAAGNAIRTREATRSRAARPEDPSNAPALFDAYNGDPNFMTSLARGLAVIQAFSQRQRELTVSQISVKTGFSRAAARRCLYTPRGSGRKSRLHAYLRHGKFANKREDGIFARCRAALPVHAFETRFRSIRRQPVFSFDGARSRSGPFLSGVNAAGGDGAADS